MEKPVKKPKSVTPEQWQKSVRTMSTIVSRFGGEVMIEMAPPRPRPKKVADSWIWKYHPELRPFLEFAMKNGKVTLKTTVAKTYYEESITIKVTPTFNGGQHGEPLEQSPHRPPVGN